MKIDGQKRRTCKRTRNPNKPECAGYAKCGDALGASAAAHDNNQLKVQLETGDMVKFCGGSSASNAHSLMGRVLLRAHVDGVLAYESGWDTKQCIGHHGCDLVFKFVGICARASSSRSRRRWASAPWSLLLGEEEDNGTRARRTGVIVGVASGAAVLLAALLAGAWRMWRAHSLARGLRLQAVALSKQAALESGCARANSVASWGCWRHASASYAAAAVVRQS